MPPPLLTQYGFTTVVDTTSDVENTVALRRRIESGEVRGPRILTAGWALYPPKGIPFYLHDMPKRFLDRLSQPETPEEGVAVLRTNFAAGSDVTKLFVATPQLNQRVARMPVEIASRAAEETHSRGNLVLAHPTDIEGIRLALAAKVDVIVHTTLGERSPWPDDLVRQMVAAHMSVIPTFKLWSYELHKDKRDPVPDAVVQRLVGYTLDQLRAFKAAGGQVLFGTDVGYMTEFDPTDEYVLMSQAGMTPLEILASLTTAPAQRWNAAERRGRLQTGMDADLVVLRADPADDPRNFAKVRCAFRQGNAIYTAAAER